MLWLSVMAFLSNLWGFFSASNPFSSIFFPDSCSGICPQISTNVNNDPTVQKNIKDGPTKSLVPLCVTSPSMGKIHNSKE